MILKVMFNGRVRFEGKTFLRDLFIEKVILILPTNPAATLSAGDFLSVSLHCLLGLEINPGRVGGIVLGRNLRGCTEEKSIYIKINIGRITWINRNSLLINP